MLYIFDLGNVIVDIDFNRVLGAWSDLTRIPLATLKQHFTMGEAFHQHERGELSDEDFAAAMCHEEQTRRRLPTCDADLFSPPPLPVYHGLEFIEFAASAA